ncbi:MAG: hypothetical protein LC634_10395 [Sphingomonadales bacterium]|nr:hypothetical protein [Sphingomonadales bacterium]
MRTASARAAGPSLHRLGASAGVGALAIITGACSESAGTDSDVVPANGGSEVAAENDAASTDGEGSTDGQAPAPGTEDEGSVDSDQSSESY